jgi:hypothetical protein
MVNETHYLVQLQALPDRTPPVIRLRSFLKAAWRSYRLRCLGVWEGRSMSEMNLVDALAGRISDVVEALGVLDDLAHLRALPPLVLATALCEVDKLAGDLEALVQLLQAPGSLEEPNCLERKTRDDTGRSARPARPHPQAGQHCASWCANRTSPPAGRILASRRAGG